MSLPCYMNYRASRLAEVIKKELSDLFQKEVKDPRVKFLTIVDVEVTGDLRHAKVFVSTLKEKNDPAELMEGLEKATGYLRKELGQRIDVRHTPEIRFIYDRSIERGQRINQILNELKGEENE